MRYEEWNVENAKSLKGARLCLYLLDGSAELRIQKRPVILICPGGAYAATSDREAETVALQFTAMGYHAAVLRYSLAPAAYPAALLELGKSVLLLRAHAEEWNVQPDGLVLVGFSAGGHLACSYATFWNREWMAKELDAQAGTLRPNGLILGYAVVTSGLYAHRESIENLLGEDYERLKEQVSLENFVGSQNPRTFIWNTCADEAVPPQNSLLLANALVEKHVPTEYHMFEKGEHGLSLANALTQAADGRCVNREAACWLALAHRWLQTWLPY